MIRLSEQEGEIVVRTLGIIAVTYLGLVIQTSLIPEDFGEIGRPFLPAFLLVLIATYCEASLAILLSGLLGLAMDGMSTERLGLQLGLGALLAFALQVMQPMWKSRSLLALVAMVMVMCACWRILAPMSHVILLGRTGDLHKVLTAAVQDSVWTGIVASVLILVCRGVVGQGSRSQIDFHSPSPRWGTATR